MYQQKNQAPSNVNIFIQKSIDEFIFSKSLIFFEKFEIKTSFLKEEPQFWNENADYKNGLEIASKIKVVNDTAVKLVGDHN